MAPRVRKPDSPATAAIKRNVYEAAGVALRMTASEVSGATRADALREEFERWTPAVRRKVRREMRDGLSILDELCYRDDNAGAPPPPVRPRGWERVAGALWLMVDGVGNLHLATVEPSMAAPEDMLMIQRADVDEMLAAFSKGDR